MWMELPHHIAHSLPLLALLGLAMCAPAGAWPRWASAWLLHILIDIPTHARRAWAPQFLWPFSAVTVDGVSCPILLLAGLQRMVRRVQ